jgi:hypothetical protein
MGSNSILIPSTSNVVNAFKTQPEGTVFSYSLNASYAGGLSVITAPGSSNVIPRKPTITPVITLGNMIKSIFNLPFVLQPTITNRGIGALSFTSSNANVATVNSSTGLVTMIGQGTTIITVLIAAAEDNTYSYLPVYTTATLEVTPPRWSQIGQDLDGERTYDNSGLNVSLSADGTVVAIGARYNVSSNGANSGRVYVYKLNGTTWTKLGQDLDGEAANDYSGTSVSLSSDGYRVAIGAPYNDGTTTNSNRGHVRVYEYNETTLLWTQLGQDIDGENYDDQSGVSVSLSADGNRVAIGAWHNGGTTFYSYKGHVRVYEYNGTTWSQLGQDIDGESANNYSGTSVSLSSDGTRVAIGAPNNNNSNGRESGHVRVYEYNETTLLWTKLGQDLDGEADFDYSGYSVSLSSDGNRVAIGALFNQNLNGQSGHVRVYEYNETTLLWTKLGQDIDGEVSGDNSGFSVSLSADGNKVAIGEPNNSNSNGAYSGRVRVYQWNGTTLQWTRSGQDIDGEAAEDQSGFSVSISADGNRVAIGAPYNDGTPVTYNRGHVRVYQLS